MAIIACKECDHRVSDRAVNCPNCGAPIAVTTAVLQRGQRAIIGAAIAFAAFALGTQVWLNMSRSPSRPAIIGKSTSASPEPAAPAERQATSASPEPAAPAERSSRAQSVAELNASTRTVYQTTAERLYQDYLANGVATQSKIANSRVRITGKISAIDEDAAGEPVVKLAASNDTSVNVTLGEDEVAAAAQLSRGQTVDVQCDMMRRVTGSPEGSHCSLALVQGISPATPVPARGAAPATPASEPGSVAAVAVTSSRKSRKSLPATTIAMVPAAISLSTGSAPASAASAPVTGSSTPATAVETTALPAGLIGPVTTTTPDPSGPAATTAPIASPPATTPDPIASPPTASAPEQRVVQATATSERSISSAEAGALAQDAPPPVRASPAMLSSDDLATVRAADPQAADHIASYCANSSAASVSGAATCRRDEKEAWTRLVQNNEFPALDEATRLKCSQPPFPDSYRAKEICAKYELRIY